MRKWIIWATATALYLFVNFHRFALGIISDQLMAAFKIAAVGLGGLSSLYFYLYAVLQMPAGILADTWGPRRTITASAVIMTAGAFVFGAAPDLATAYLECSSYSPVQHDLEKPKEKMLLDRVRNANAGAAIVTAAKMCEPGLEEQVTYTHALEEAGIPYFVGEFQESMTSFEQMEVQLETFVENILFS